MLNLLINTAGVYVLVLFRVAGMMIFAPLLGSSRIPKRVRVIVALVLAAALAPSVAPPAQLPQDAWQMTLAIGGEILFGLAMGFILSMIFVAAQWAGEIFGQQMGLNLGETFDPQYGARTSAVGDIYYFLTLMIFLAVDGDRATLRGLHDSFGPLPLLSVGINRPILDMIIGLFGAATHLAMQLAAPILVTMIIVDLVLGFVGKTVPQLNVMTAGIALRSLVGMVVLIVGLSLTSAVIRDSLFDSMKLLYSGYTTP
jgi:flagellar biosynthetic protein FliR